MATTYHGGGQQQCQAMLSRPLERVFEDAQHTGEIQLNYRKLREYPKMAAKYDLVDTISADVSKNRLSEVPKELCSYMSMEKLNCYHNVIKSIPEAIVQLQALTYLNLSRNQLFIIPPFISQLQTLEVLIASHNRLVSLPEEIGVLDKLMELDVSCNEIAHLPVQIGDLKSLKSLNVRRNLLEILPIEISKLNLRKLDMSGNRISRIPTVFRKIETLEDIVLHNNPLILPPAHVCTKGKQHIMKYLQIEAIREDKKRGMLNEVEMKRFRKSLPPQQSVSSEEFRNLMESPDKWKRHTVLSSDSGYSTTDSIEKCGWSPQENNGGDLQHLIDSNNLAARAAGTTNGTDPRTVAPREPRREPPEPPKRINSRLSPEKPTVVQTSPPAAPYTQPKPMFVNPPPTPPSLYSPNAQMPVTPPTPQGPGPGVGGAVTSPGQTTPEGGLVDEFTRELQRQKQEYENKKKIAEQLRLQQEEEEEREQRRRAAQRIQDEQRALLDRQREEAEESKRQEEMRRAEETRKAEEARRQEEEARRRDEAQKQEAIRRQEEARAIEEAKQHRVENNFYFNNKSNYAYNNAWPPPPPGLTNQHEVSAHSQYSPRSQWEGQSPSQYGHQNSSMHASQAQHHSQVHSPPSQYVQSPNDQHRNSSSSSPYSQSSSDQHRVGSSSSQYSLSPNDHHRVGFSPQYSQSSSDQYRVSSSQYSVSPTDQHRVGSSSSQYSQSSNDQRRVSSSSNFSQSSSPDQHRFQSPPSHYPQSPVDRHRLTSPSYVDHGAANQQTVYNREQSDPSSHGHSDNQHGYGGPDPYNSMPQGQHESPNSAPLDPYSGYRKPALSASNSFKEERRPVGTSQPYRRTVSDSNQRSPGQKPHPSSHPLTNGPIPEQPSVNGSTSSSMSTSPNPSPNTSFTSQHSTPPHNATAAHNPPASTNGPTVDRPSSIAARRTRVSEQGTTPATTTSRMTKPGERSGRTSAASSATSSPRPGVRKTNLNQNEEVRKSQQSLKSSSLADGPKARGEQRLRTIQKEAVTSYNRRSSGSTSSEDDRKRVTPTRTTGLASSASTAASKRAGTVMTSAQVKMLEEYKEPGNFTLRRQHDQQREVHEHMDTLRKTISTRLKRSLPENLSEALSDGVLLCHLANQIRPRSVASVHVPSPAVPKLTPAKCRRNVENFLEACRKIGVHKDQICGARDILEEKGLNLVAVTVAALVSIATHGKHVPASNV